jgi:membrane-associated phospholipid phosphatase
VSEMYNPQLDLTLWVHEPNAGKKRYVLQDCEDGTLGEVETDRELCELVASDPQTAPYFRTTRSFQGFNSAFSGRATAIGTVLAPSSLYIAGLLRKDSYAKNTALLAGEAVADSEILTTVLKDIDGRLRPAAVPPNGNFADTWFDRKGSILRGNGSFPSGHTIAAFSVATVTARRYGRQHRWVPIVAYGAAAAVGFSRITLSSHFPSDVFMGAALGYSIGRFAVLRQ